MKRRRTLALILAAVVGIVAASCTGDDAPDATPSAPSDGTVTTALIDYSGVALGSVRGTTTTTALAAVGTSAIVGTVTGPAGPVPGATVRIERLVGSAAPVDVLTDAVGHYELRNLPGGRYRVRAFLAPAFALVEPAFFFVSAGAEQVADLAVTDQRGIRARAAVAPATPVLDEDVNLAVLVVSRRVDADGVVRGVPVSNVRVELDGLGAWRLRERTQPGFPTPGRFGTTTTTTFATASSASFTDSGGRAAFELHCSQSGAPGLSLRISVMVTPATVPGEVPGAPVPQIQTIPLDLPDCVDPTIPVVDPNAPTTTEP